MLLYVLGWMFLITSWILPESWFSEKKYMHGMKAVFCGFALLIFVAGFFNVWFKWW